MYVVLSENRMIGETVIQHQELPELNMLLIGRHPDIYSGAMTARQPVREPLQGSVPRMNPRFKRDAPDFTPGDIPRTARGDGTRKSLTKQSALLSQFRRDEEFADTMTQKLSAYSDAHKVKTIVHEADYMDHFYRPLQYRIKEKMMGQNYENYKKQKELMIRHMDLHPVPIRSPRKLPPVPGIKVSEVGLRDPTNKYVEHAVDEVRLSKFINEANGIKVEEKKLPPINTLDYRMYKVHYQTRFFFGKDEVNGNKTGRRVYPETGRSRVGHVLNFY